MGELISLKNQAQKQRKAKAKGITLCRRGFHQWVIDKHKPFDVKTGKLVTVRRCSRCQAVQNQLV